jgi:hypothetical protein
MTCKIFFETSTARESLTLICNRTPGNGGYGQNLALFGASGNVKAKSQSASIAEAITDMWHNGEVAAYPWGDAGKPNPDMSNFETWGHFSQVVWASTEQVGCATQFCEAGTIYDTMASWFTVCDYFPAGKSRALPTMT